MKTTFTNKVLLAAIGVSALALTAGTAMAQTEPVSATVEVLNTLTITEVDPLDFGIVAAVSHNVNTATLAIDALTDVLAPSTTGAPAVFAVIDNATASAAQITVEDGADGASLVIEIDNVTNPILGPSAFTLNGFETAWNGGAVAARVIGTPFNYTFLDAFGGGVNTIDIGAAVVTQVGVATYADGIYVGSFDAIFSY